VSRSVEIAAPAQAVLDLVSDPRAHVHLDGSGTLYGVAFGRERLTLGAEFGMSMRAWGVPYRMTKLAGEELARAAAECSGLPVSVLRIGTVRVDDGPGACRSAGEAVDRTQGVGVVGVKRLLPGLVGGSSELEGLLTGPT